MKAISSLENRWILLKGTINKTISKEKGFLNFLSPLMITGIQLMIIASLAINVLIPLGLTEEASESDTAIQNLWITHDCTDNLNWRNEWIISWK